MEIEALNNINCLNKIICQECGLPLIINSYEMTEFKKLIIKLNCSNPDHKKINVNFEDFKKIINNNLNNICKCIFCQKIIQNDKTQNYCYDCQKIICLDCKEKHNNHCKIMEYKYYKNIYLNNNYNNIDYSSSNHLSDIVPSVNIFDEKNKGNLSKIKNNINNMDYNRYNIICNSSLNSKNKKYINIIYHDENLEKSARFKSIVNDCNFFGDKINGSIILTNNYMNLRLVLEIILKNKSKSKFFLIINGGSSRDTIKCIIDNNYKSLFLGAIIYTTQKEAFLDFQNNNSDFVKAIYVSKGKIIESINKIFTDEKIINDKFFINKLITWKSYKNGLNNLKKELINFYGNESENSFKEHFEKFKEFIKEREFPNDMKNKIITDFKIFSELMNKNYEKIISNYLTNYNFSKIINLLLDTKEKSIYEKIGYFAGNFMHCLEEYGKNMKKRVKSTKTFYRGMQLNIIDVLEYYKNNKSSITFPFFLSVTTKKELAEISSKRNISDEERKKKDIFSVILQIEYLNIYNEQTYVFELKDLSPIPEEDEYILFPFTFFEIKSVTIDSKKFIVDIQLKIIQNID